LSDEEILDNNCPYAYDSILALGTAINNVIVKYSNSTRTTTTTTPSSVFITNSDKIDTDSMTTMGMAVLEELKQLDIIGATGRIKFDSNLDRIGMFYQLKLIFNNASSLVDTSSSSSEGGAAIARATVAKAARKSTATTATASSIIDFKLATWTFER